MSVRRDADTLMDSQESLRRIADCIVSISYEQFRQDTRRQDAVIRNLKIPGEAAKNLSASFRKHCSDIP